jgi:hypothetical protein
MIVDSAHNIGLLEKILQIQIIFMNLEEDFDELEYPTWVYRDIIDEDTLLWQQGIRMTFIDFHKKYTLHDSDWIGIFFDVGYQQTATLAIQWDPVWLPDSIAKSTSKVSDWLYLFIKLQNVTQFSTGNYVDIGGNCRSIACCEIEEIDGKKILAIDDVYGGQINIIYQGKETFLAMDKNRCVLSI